MLELIVSLWFLPPNLFPNPFIFFSPRFHFLSSYNKCYKNYKQTMVLLTSSDELVHEKEKYKSITDDLDQTFSELSAY